MNQATTSLASVFLIGMCFSANANENNYPQDKSAKEFAEKVIPEISANWDSYKILKYGDQTSGSWINDRKLLDFSMEKYRAYGRIISYDSAYAVIPASSMDMKLADDPALTSDEMRFGEPIQVRYAVNVFFANEGKGRIAIGLSKLSGEWKIETLEIGIYHTKNTAVIIFGSPPILPGVPLAPPPITSHPRQ